MNGFGDLQRALVTSHQADLRSEADTTRLAADATFAAAAERTRHLMTDERTSHRSAPLSLVPAPVAAATPTGCAGGHESSKGQAVAA